MKKANNTLTLSLLMTTCLYTVSCNNNGTGTVSAPVIIADTAAASNEKIVKQYFERFNSHQWAKMADMYTDTAEFKDPSLGIGIIRQTKQQTIAKYTELGQQIPDVHDEIVQLYPSGNKHIIVEFVSKGTAPDNTTFSLPICTVFTIEGGKISKDFTYYDNWEEPKPEKK